MQRVGTAGTPREALEKLYGLTRDDLCYILDLESVLSESYPSETLRVLKGNEKIRNSSLASGAGGVGYANRGEIR